MGNTVGRQLSDVERAYIAGFIDGDGSVMALIEQHSEKRFGFRVRIELRITQHHEKDVAWLQQEIGLGYIRHNRTVYDWVLRDQKAALWLLQQLIPYARSKQKQMIIACEILEHPITTFEELYKVASLADYLSSFNVRSKLRRKNFASKVVPVTTDPEKR